MRQWNPTNTKKNVTIALGLHHKTTWFLFQSSAWFHASLNSSILSPRVGSSSKIQHGIMWQVSKPAPRFGSSSKLDFEIKFHLKTLKIFSTVKSFQQNWQQTANDVSSKYPNITTADSSSFDYVARSKTSSSCDYVAKSKNCKQWPNNVI